MGVSDKWMTLLLVLVSSGTGIALLDFAKFVWRQHKEEFDIVSGLKALGEVYTIMEEMRRLGATRVILFAGHNSGGMPRPGAPFYTTALHFSASKEHLPYIAEYQNLTLDGYYISMLCQATVEGMIAQDTGTMPDSQLRDYYLMEGVHHGLTFHLGVRDKAMFYLSVATADPEGFSSEALTRLTLKANRIRYLMENH